MKQNNYMVTSPFLDPLFVHHTKWFKLLVLMLTLNLGVIGCANKSLLVDRDYAQSVEDFKRGIYQNALNNFPKKEDKGFITSVEKGWIRLWLHEQQMPADLLRQASTFDERKFVSVSREARYFLFQESEEGYVPSEHEVIILHLLSAMTFMQNSQWDEARVEARRASFYLQGQFNANQVHFDDPALRVWAGSVWAALGEWQEALVDFRVAYELTRDEELKKYLELKKSPENLSIIFYGVAPTVEWDNSSLTPKFIENKSSPIFLLGQKATGNQMAAFSTYPWFAYQIERNNALRDSLQKSNYMARYMGEKAQTGSQIAGTKVVTSSLRLTGVVVGVVIAGGGLYALSTLGSGAAELASYALAAGVGLGAYFWKHADKFGKRMAKEIEEDEAARFESQRNYRFLRFMPEWIVLKAKIPEGFSGSSNIILKAPKSDTQVHFTHYLNIQ